MCSQDLVQSCLQSKVFFSGTPLAPAVFINTAKFKGQPACERFIVLHILINRFCCQEGLEKEKTTKCI
ncbi:Hypothetical predicted protein [Cloeon dipterum]|uniref:Uncharacterized protein n=1 Tax=Cloeon dipterum TaxID=197152 RepID=A0A8S1D9L3_9INSE|nr:Hypothetical predicted protein [Cloeon dipterum]